MPHGGLWERDAEVIVFYLNPKFVALAAHDLVSSEQIEIVAAPTAEDPFIRQLAGMVKTEIGGAKLLENLFMDSAANLLAVHLLRNYATKDLFFRQNTHLIPAERINSAIEFINDNLAQNLSLTEIARVAGLSPHYFAVLFKRATNQTVHQWCQMTGRNRTTELSEAGRN